MSVNQFETVTGALNAARKRGYTHTFKVQDRIAYCLETKKEYHPNEMEIVEYHRFEGTSDPEDMSVVYLVECTDGLKGVLIDAYGAYSDENMSIFLENVQVEEGI